MDVGNVLSRFDNLPMGCRHRVVGSVDENKTNRCTAPDGDKTDQEVLPFTGRYENREPSQGLKLVRRESEPSRPGPIMPFSERRAIRYQQRSVTCSGDTTQVPLPNTLTSSIWEFIAIKSGEGMSAFG